MSVEDNETLKALYDFQMTVPQTIGFKRGDIFIFHPSVNRARNWWLVIASNGQIGYIPSNYVESIQVGAKFHYDFLTKCITNIENSNVHRKQEVVAYLRKRQHSAATTLGLRNARSPVPPQRTSSSPTVARCNSALAFTSTFANNDIFSNVSKNATLPKSKKKSQKNLNANNDSDYNRGGHIEPVNRAPSPEQHVEETPIINSDGMLLNTKRSTKSFTSFLPDNRKVGMNGDDNNIDVENLYVLIQEVRCATQLSHEMSKVAINVVIKGLQELLPCGSTTSLTSLQSVLTSDFTVPENMIDKTYDAERLRVVMSELVSCKEDSQQRSWELYEDEEVISEYLNELISILKNADPVICCRVLTSDSYENINKLLQYYQMEVRWPIRELLIQAFCCMCAIHPPVVTLLLNSVLPMELARDMVSNASNIPRLSHSAEMLTTIFSRGEPMPITHLEQVGCEFVEFLLHLIEEPPDTDIHDVIPDKFLQVILSYNLQFPRHSSQNIVLSALGRRNNAKTFTEKMLLLLNREDDPIKVVSNKKTAGKSLFKIIYDLFTYDKTAALFYTNDIKVLIDIIVRQLNDLSPGEEKRTEYLELCRMVLRNTNYNEHLHRRTDLQKCFTRIFCEDSQLSSKDQNIVRDISNEFPQYFKH